MTKYISDARRRRIVIGTAAACALMLAGLAYLIGRQEATRALFSSAVGLVAVEVIYGMNILAGGVFGRAGSARLTRASNAFGAIVFGSAAIAGICAGVYLLVRP